MIKSIFTLLAVTAVPLSCLHAADALAPEERWGRTPLGPAVEAAPVEAVLKQPLASHLQVMPAEGDPLVFVGNGTAQAVIVLPHKPNVSESAAARVLQSTIEKMSSVRLPIVNEGEASAADAGADGAYVIAVGATHLAKEKGLSAADLRADGYLLQTQGNTLFVLGKDEAAAQPRKRVGAYYTQANGTRNAAYGLLERHFDCRWLWPAEGGGEVIPVRSTVSLAALNERDEPAILQRGIRNYYPEKGVNSIYRRHQQSVLADFDEPYSAFLRKAHNSGEWFEAMRLGSAKSVDVGHAFSNYWKLYGQSHPEWFALQAPGIRDQARGSSDGHRAQLCVSNEELIEAVAAEVIAKFDADPERQMVSISANDGTFPSFCLCERCRLLDPPSGAPVSFSIMDVAGKASRIGYVSLTDRYLTFYNKVAERVKQKYPDRKLGSYAYSVYSAPPLYTQPDDTLYLSYVGLSYINEQQRQQDLDAMKAWAAQVNGFQLRPNALFGGYGIPAIFVTKMGEDVKLAYQLGMDASDFDALTHDWGSRGLNYYVLAKLLWDPSLDVEELVQDYCRTGFGPAAPAIRSYYRDLEALTDVLAERSAGLNREEDGIDPRSVRGVVHLIGEVYTPEALARLNGLLDEAATLAKGDGPVLQRIDFLRQGLRYAQVEAEASRAFSLPRGAERNARVRAALEERRAVHRDIYRNHFYAQGIIYSNYRQSSLWKPFEATPEKKGAAK